MKIILTNYQVNQNHSFLFSNNNDYNNFLLSHKVAEQEYNNRYISERTTEIIYKIDDVGFLPKTIGYIIIETNDEYNSLLNFIVTGWERISNEGLKFYVTADIFRNDLNGTIHGMEYSTISGYVEQTNGVMGSVDSTQIIPPSLGDPIEIEAETYPLKNDNGTNWVIIITGETQFGNYGVFATDYTDDIGTITAFARSLTKGTTITLASDTTKNSTFKATACYIVPKGIIRSGYAIPELAHEINTLTNIYVYPINAFFNRVEIPIPETNSLKIYDFGTIAKRLTINKQYSTPLYIISSFNSSDISIGIQYNNIYLDVTDDFAYPIVTDEFSQYASLNKRDFAIKSTTAVGSVVVGAVLASTGVATGNLMQAGAGAASILTGVSKMSTFEDKNEQPFTVTGNNNGCANITFNNGFSFRTYQGRNYEEAYRSVLRFGYQYKRVVRGIKSIISEPNRHIGRTFVRFKMLTDSDYVRSETYARLLNGVFV